MGLPNIEVAFQMAGASAIDRSQGKIVGVILRGDANIKNPLYMTDVTEIPGNLSTYNKEQLQLAFKGYVTVPKAVILYQLPTTEPDYKKAQDYFETVNISYIVAPGIEAGDTDTFASWIKSCRDQKKIKLKAVLPHCKADHEGIINFTTDDIVVGANKIAAKDYCSRIAGILAGTPMEISATYAKLSEVDDVPHLTEKEASDKIDAGEFILYYEDESVKVGRAVNSLTTLTSAKREDLQKIKIVELLDMVFYDIRKTAKDNYVGKYANIYDNKVLLIVAIGAYFKELERSQLLKEGVSVVQIDEVKNASYLEGKGVDISKLTAQEIKEANTGSNVFLDGAVSPIDAMEDIFLNIAI